MRKLLALALLALLFMPPIAIAQEEGSTAIKYSLLGEGMEVLYGENGAVGIVAFRFGGTVDFGVDFSAPHYANMKEIHIAVGKGSDWALYLHRPIWEIPPGIFVMINYQLKVGYSRDAALADIMKAKGDLEQFLGVKLFPMFEEAPEGTAEEHVLFYAPINETQFLDFYQNKFASLYGGKGLLSLITSAALQDSPYARIIMFIGKDSDDSDRDGDMNELVAGMGVGFIVADAIKDEGDGWYSISLKDILGFDAPISWDNESNWSVIKFRFPFPLIIDENATTPSNSSFPEVTGVFEWLLHASDPSGNWTVSWPSELSDITVKFKPLNYTELQNFPVLRAWLTYDPPVITGLPTSITIGIHVENDGTTPAYNTRVVWPIEEDTYHELKNLERMGFISFGSSVRFVPRYTREERKWLMIVDIGELANGTAKEYTLITITGITPEIARDIEILHIPIGPIVKYKTAEGYRGAVLAGGVAYPVAQYGSLLNATVSIETESGASFATVGETATVKVAFWSHGNMPATDIHYEVWHAIVDESGQFLEVDVIGSGSIEELGRWDEPTSNNVTLEHVYKVRTRPGLHVVGVVYSYKVQLNYGEGAYTIDVKLASNFVSMFVLPPARLRGNIFRYPLPHAELKVDKTVSFDNTTGAFKVHIEITNVGDINTTVLLVADYWNASLVSFDNKVYINGTEKTAAGVPNDRIGVLYVISVSKDWLNDSIVLRPNETIVIEYQLYPKVTGTVKLDAYPTLVIYDFGPYQMIREEGPSGGKEERAVGEAAIHGAALKIAQATGGSQNVQTYTDALILTASVAAKPRVREGTILLLGILIISTLAVALYISRKRSK